MLDELKKTITKEEIEKLPLFSYTGEIQVIENPTEAEKIANLLKEQKILGFDTETRPAFRKGETYKVALIQLAAPDKVYLFRLNKCGWVKSLCQLLENPQTIKIGVGIRDDLRNLRKWGEFNPAAFTDMQDYAGQIGIQEKSFSKLMAIIFNVKISKRQRVTNWEAQQLTEPQIKYAATDAWGCLRMYQQLSDKQSG